MLKSEQKNLACKSFTLILSQNSAFLLLLYFLLSVLTNFVNYDVKIQCFVSELEFNLI
jgi:hypothetical protein